MSDKYLHGYDQKEQERLYRQAKFLENIIFSDIDFSFAKNLLEVGCGVGAQSEILLRRFPNLHLTGIELSDNQLKRAKEYLSNFQYAQGRYELITMDAKDMDFGAGQRFDAAYLCWVLEHIPNPVDVLSEVRRVLKPGSVVYVTEVLNSSFFVEPYSPNVLKYWMHFNDLQYEMGGDPFIGAKLGNLLQSLGYANIKTSIKTIHLDNRNPVKRAQMIEYWTNLLLSAVNNLLESEHIKEESVQKVKQELKIVGKDPNAVFYYSFVQAQAYTS